MAIGMIALRALRPTHRHRNVGGKSLADGAPHLPGAAAGLLLRPARFRTSLGFTVPLVFLLHQSIRRGLLAHFDTAIWLHAGHSVMFAAFATLAAALLLGFATIIANRWRSSAWMSLSAAVTVTGYALPGLVLALGSLPPLLAVDNGLNILAIGLACRCRA